MKKSTKEDIKRFLLIVGAGVIAEVITEFALNRLPLAAAAPEILPELVLKTDTQHALQSERQLLVI